MTFASAPPNSAYSTASLRSHVGSCHVHSGEGHHFQPRQKYGAGLPMDPADTASRLRTLIDGSPGRSIQFGEF